MTSRTAPYVPSYTSSSHAVSDHGRRQESVVFGNQIYACTVQRTAAFAFAEQRRARLTGGIHTFVSRPPLPQWHAADGSAVTGKVVPRTPTARATSPN